MGVSCLLVISGFVVALTSKETFSVLNRKAIVRFYFTRLVRLYPVYFLTMLLSVPIIYWTHFQMSMFSFFCNILMIQSWFPNGIQVFSFNGMGWFVSTLWFLCLVTPFLLRILGRVTLKQAAACGMLVFVAAIIVASQFTVGIDAYSFGWWFFYISPYFRIFDYVLGILAGLVFSRLQYAVRSSRMSLFTLLELAALASFVAYYKLRYVALYSILSYPTIRILLIGIYYSPLIALVLIAFAFQKGLLSSLMNNRFTKFLGVRTYAALMLHLEFFSYLGLLISANINYNTIPSLLGHVLLFIIVISLADEIYRHYEMPIRRRSDNWMLQASEASPHQNSALVRSP